MHGALHAHIDLTAVAADGSGAGICESGVIIHEDSSCGVPCIEIDCKDNAPSPVYVPLTVRLQQRSRVQPAGGGWQPQQQEQQQQQQQHVQAHDYQQQQEQHMHIHENQQRQRQQQQQQEQHMHIHENQQRQRQRQRQQQQQQQQHGHIHDQQQQEGKGGGQLSCPDKEVTPLADSTNQSRARAGFGGGGALHDAHFPHADSSSHTHTNHTHTNHTQTNHTHASRTHASHTHTNHTHASHIHAIHTNHSQTSYGTGATHSKRAPTQTENAQVYETKQEAPCQYEGLQSRKHQQQQQQRPLQQQILPYQPQTNAQAAVEIYDLCSPPASPILPLAARLARKHGAQQQQQQQQQLLQAAGLCQEQHQGVGQQQKTHAPEMGQLQHAPQHQACNAPTTLASGGGSGGDGGGGAVTKACTSVNVGVVEGTDAAADAVADAGTFVGACAGHDAGLAAVCTPLERPVWLNKRMRMRSPLPMPLLVFDREEEGQQHQQDSCGTGLEEGGVGGECLGGSGGLQFDEQEQQHNAAAQVSECNQEELRGGGWGGKCSELGGEGKQDDGWQQGSSTQSDTLGSPCLNWDAACIHSQGGPVNRSSSVSSVQRAPGLVDGSHRNVHSIGRGDTMQQQQQQEQLRGMDAGGYTYVVGDDCDEREAMVCSPLPGRPLRKGTLSDGESGWPQSPVIIEID